MIHVHSTHSDGTFSPRAIARVAEGQGLDFLLLTDHNTLAAQRDGETGLRRGVLLLAGEEISTADGHYLALRLKNEVPAREEGQWTIHQVAEQGGLGFIAHPFLKRKPWELSDGQGFTGLEIYNADHDISGENWIRLTLETLLLGSDASIAHWIDRPAEALALWDRLASEGRPVVGIGGADAHGLQRFGLRLGPYSTLFKLVRNHLLIEGDLSEETVYAALEKGRLFVAHDIVADARGFLFAAVEDQALRGVMGDRVRWSHGLQLYAYLPSPGEMMVLKDGREWARQKGQEGRFSVPGPGVYRVEAARKGKPWVYSNPIYVIE